MTVASAPIIVIDQNAGMCRAIGEMLRQIGYTHVVYDNGSRALEKLAADLYSLIILEWRSDAEVNNDYLAETFCSDTRLSRIPRIMVSSDPTLGAAEAAKAAGGTGYLIKPVSTEKLQKQVLKILGTPTIAQLDASLAAQKPVQDQRRHIRFVEPKLEMIIDNQYYQTLNWSLGGLALVLKEAIERSESPALIPARLKIETDSVVYEDQVTMVASPHKNMLCLRFQDESKVPMAILHRIIREKGPSMKLVADTQTK